MEAKLIRRERRQTSSTVLSNLPLICCCCATKGCSRSRAKGSALPREVKGRRSATAARPAHTAGEELRPGGDELALKRLGVGALGAPHGDAPLLDPPHHPQEVAVAQQEGRLELPVDKGSVTLCCPGTEWEMSWFCWTFQQLALHLQRLQRHQAVKGPRGNRGENVARKVSAKTREVMRAASGALCPALKRPSYLQPHQTGEPSEDVHVQTADAVVGQISVGNRKDRISEDRWQTRPSLHQSKSSPGWSSLSTCPPPARWRAFACFEHRLVPPTPRKLVIGPPPTAPDALFTLPAVRRTRSRRHPRSKPHRFEALAPSPPE